MSLIVALLLVFPVVRCLDKDTIVFCENEIATVDCSSGSSNGTSSENAFIKIDAVQYGNTASKCGSPENGMCMHHTIFGIQKLCQNKTACTFNVTNAVVGSSCGGQSLSALEITYHCVDNGMWSEWGGWGDCSRSCSGGYQSRTRPYSNPEPNEYGVICPGNDTEYRRCNTQACSYPIVFCENEIATVDCSNGTSSENAFIEIDAVQYGNTASRCGSPDNGMCIHHSIFGIQKLCQKKTVCTFNVTNAVVGSSCGGKSLSALEITYHCVDNGMWSDWGGWVVCSRSCSGGYQSRTRTCSNPEPNQYGVICPGNDTEYRRCNTGSCPYSGSTCRNNNFCAECNTYDKTGRIQILNGTWKQGCSWNYSSVSHDVVATLSTQCNDRYKCCVSVDDNLQSCYTDYYYTSYYATSYRSRKSCWINPCYTTKYRTKSYTLRSIKICGILDYTYSCTIPQWSIWSDWTACSVTCDTGTQTRTRQCENDKTTDDGYDLSCEGDMSEIRECNNEWCKGCEDRSFGYQTSIDSIVQNETITATAYVLQDVKDIIHCCGVVNRWEFFPVNEGTLQFVLWRLDDITAMYKVMGVNTIDIQTSDTGKIMSYEVPKNERFVIVAKDMIGWYDSGQNILKSDLCDSSNNCPMKTKYATFDDATVGDTFDWDDVNDTIPNRVYALHYSTVENSPPSLDMATHEATIPDHTPIDASVMDFHFSDDDTGDWFTEYGIEDNDWFYLDFEKGSIHVKTDLPHGTEMSSQVHTVVITATDSCLNTVTGTGTVTITTTNHAVEFTDLPANIEVSNDETGYRSIHKFSTYDRSVPKDNVTCDIEDVDPQTIEVEFTIQYSSMSGNKEEWTVYSNTSDNKWNESHYQLDIACSDGLDTTNETLEIEIIDAAETSTEDAAETSTEDSAETSIEDFNSKAVVPVAIIMVMCLSVGFATVINYMR